MVLLFRRETQGFAVMEQGIVIASVNQRGDVNCRQPLSSEHQATITEFIAEEREAEADE